MKIEQLQWTRSTGWQPNQPKESAINPQLIFVFGSRSLLENREQVDILTAAYPEGEVLLGSTAGEIFGTRVNDDTLSLTAIELEHTKIETATIDITEYDNSFNAGKALAEKINTTDLSHVFVLSEGTHVNGTALVNGAKSVFSSKINITGGLAGDGADFEKTMVYFSKDSKSEQVAIIGFYGSHIHIGFGSESGWKPFGPIRKITKSEGNKLFELDNENALDLYKMYLGDQASGLPATGLLFPLNIKGDEAKDDRIRTLLSIDEGEKSMIFAGDIPTDAKAQFMRASTEELVDGAIHAAENTELQSPDLAILVSCVGRKLVMKQRVEEEVEAVQQILGPNTVLTGFYSYGEICPSSEANFSALHNQTMTVTTFKET